MFNFNKNILKGNNLKRAYTKFLSTNNYNLKMLHSKTHHGHCKIIIDPFVNYKGESKNFDLVFKIDNDHIPVPIDVLEITSDKNIHKDFENQMNSDQVFDFKINETNNLFYVEPKSREKLFHNLKDLKEFDKHFHFILRVQNSRHVHIELSNCDLKLHNSTHFKFENEENKNSEKLSKIFDSSNLHKNSNPIEINPNFEKFSCVINKSNIVFEKFDHKFLNGNYQYEFKLENNSDIKLKRFFIHKFDMLIDSSQIFIDKLSGYKISKDDENHTKNVVSINANNSLVKIFNYINCGNFFYNSELKNTEISEFPSNETNSKKFQSNTLSIDNFSSNSFDVRLAKKDKVNLNLYEILDNSNLKFDSNSDLKIKIHPVLLCGINIFQEFNKKFMKVLFFEDEGFIQSPTLVLNGQIELKKKDITGWELVKLKENKYIKKIFLFSVLIFVITLFINDKNDLNSQYSEFKLYQLFLKKTLEVYIENKSDSK